MSSFPNFRAAVDSRRLRTSPRRRTDRMRRFIFEGLETRTLLSFTLTGTAGNEITGVEGSSTGTVLLGTFVDANQAATVADYTTPPGSVVVNWGDGSAPQTLAASNLTAIGTPNGVVWTINAAHTYTEEGTYAYTVTVTDVDGAATIVSGSAIIADAALTAGAATLLTPNTGVALPATTVVGTFTDANTFATTADFTATIDWGDGSPQSTGVVVATATPGVFDVEGGHTYAKPGVYTTLITVNDDGGSQVVITGSATVTDLPVTGATKSFTAVEGQNTGQFVLATFTDPNTLATVADVNATLADRRLGRRYADRRRASRSSVQQIGVTPLTAQPIRATRSSRSSAATPTPRRRPRACPTPSASSSRPWVASTTTLTSPPGGGVTVLDAPLTSSNGTEITGIEGNSTDRHRSCSGPSPTPTRLRPSPTSPPAAARSSSTGATARRRRPWPPRTSPPSARPTAWSSPSTPPHTYAEEGTYAYTVTVTDDGGAVTTIFSARPSSPTPRSPPRPPSRRSTPPRRRSSRFRVFAPPVFNGPVAVVHRRQPGRLDRSPTSRPRSTGATAPRRPPARSASPGQRAGDLHRQRLPHLRRCGRQRRHRALTRSRFSSQDDGGSRLTVDNTANVADNPIVSDRPAQSGDRQRPVDGHRDITNVKQPDFFGTVGAASRTSPCSATLLPRRGRRSSIGQVQAGSDGSWNITSDVPLADGHYTITATAIDQFGDDHDPRSGRDHVQPARSTPSAR